MKTIKSLALFLLVSLTCNAFGMEQDWPAAEQEIESRVPSLRKLCAKRVADLIKQDPEFYEKKGQSKLTEDAQRSVVSELMKDHPIVPLILQKLKIIPPLKFTGHTDDWLKPAGLQILSPDGSQTLTTSYDRTAKLWNKNTGACIQTFTGHINLLMSAIFSPDGSQILTASLDHTAKLWNAQTGTCIRTFSGHTNLLMSAIFSPDGKEILAASDDNTAKLWNITPILQMSHYLTHEISLKQAILFDLIQKKITEGNTSSLNEKQLELFNDLQPEVKTILNPTTCNDCTMLHHRLDGEKNENH